MAAQFFEEPILNPPCSYPLRHWELDASGQPTNQIVENRRRSSGEVRSDGAEGIACWFIDTDYNEESFFVRHAYFLGANDPSTTTRPGRSPSRRAGGLRCR